ncbi:hypothetical protein [Phytoactinopolyspora mesophila]|uniref:Minor tail protein n=1 Tax=Phytoactinopolyspora mesophila TaxID=2650750 RepID=A0A7K3M5X4_9ACTN|nr:hypothetical protein [Phytoactinopolyspora mesophila]NDL58645.1 hypothetical protein [Phytoactinopolyspora mesophila]
MVRIGEITDVSDLSWSRERNSVSSAQVTVINPTPECCGLLSRVEPWRNELVIYRGNERVWDGVVMTPQWSREAVTITARDMLIWTQRAILKTGYTDNRRSVVDRSRLILQSELARFENLNPPINVLPFLQIYASNVTRQSREILDFEKYVLDELEDLATAGAHFATVGRSIYIYNRTSDALGSSATVSENDFVGDDITITAHGMDFGTYAAVTDGEGHAGDAGGTDPYYGLVERLTTQRPEGRDDGDPVDTEALAEQARLDLAGRNPVPVRLRVGSGATLDPRTALTIDDLVPGRRVPIRTEMMCRTVTSEQVVDRVQVTENAGGERIQVTLDRAPFTGGD